MAKMETKIWVTDQENEEIIFKSQKYITPSDAESLSRRIKKMYRDVYFEIMTTTNLWLCVKTGILQMHFTECIVKYKYVFQRKYNCKTV